MALLPDLEQEGAATFQYELLDDTPALADVHVLDEPV